MSVSSHNSKNRKRSTIYVGVYSAEFIKRTSGHTKDVGLRFFGEITINYTRHRSINYLTEREAALWYDKKRIEHGLPPVNILKPKQ